MEESQISLTESFKGRMAESTLSSPGIEPSTRDVSAEDANRFATGHQNFHFENLSQTQYFLYLWVRECKNR